MMTILIYLFIILAILYVAGIIKLYDAFKEIERLQNGYMAKRIDMIYQECKKEIDDGK